MARTDAIAVVQRLLDDDAVHERLVQGGTAARDAYLRARGLPARKAVEDKTLYAKVREAATGLTEATRQALGQPEPRPPRGRRVVAVLVLGATAAVVVWAARRHDEAQGPPT
jgi:hypothetical protein